MPFAKPVQTETQTQTTTLPRADVSVWADKYEEFLLSVINGKQTVVNYELEVENCRFGVKNIDSDDIPELLISEGNFPGSKVSVFGYDGFEMRLIGSVGESGEMSYVPGENKIISSEITEGQESFLVYSIEEYKISEVFNATKLNGEDGVIFLINDSEVSEEEYENQLKGNTPESVETVGRNLYELKSEFVLPVVENNTALIDRALEENSVKAEESESQASEEDGSVNPATYGDGYATAEDAFSEETGYADESGYGDFENIT